MPAEIASALTAAGLLRSDGPLAPATVRRRVSSWSTLHRWRGLLGPFASPALRAALRLAVRASARPRRRKSRRAVTRDVLDKLLAVCTTDRLADCRARALLLVAFASGGRRRSEIAALRVEQCTEEQPVAFDPADPKSLNLPYMAIHLGRTETTAADEDLRALLVGPPVEALRLCLERADIGKGPRFFGPSTAGAPSKSER